MASRPANRSWPAFFEQGLGVPVTPIASPELVYRGQRRLNLPATLGSLVTRLGAFRRSTRFRSWVLQSDERLDASVAMAVNAHASGGRDRVRSITPETR